MQNAETSPIASQKDNMLGICHAIGEDFGFNPIYMRIALAVMLLFNPVAMLITYGSAGVLVLASRLLIRPTRRRAKKAAPPRLAEIAAPSHAAHEPVLEAIAA